MRFRNGRLILIEANEFSKGLSYGLSFFGESEIN